jgi:hypothetical protein
LLQRIENLFKADYACHNERFALMRGMTPNPDKTFIERRGRTHALKHFLD